CARRAAGIYGLESW
nr:immunoglobulin heavy chain junction region [Macaca mulatta]